MKQWRRVLGAAFAAGALSGCDQIESLFSRDGETKAAPNIAPDGSSTTETDAPLQRANVIISDVIAAGAGPVTDVGFWVHPTLAFNSLVIVASAQGVNAYDIETRDAVASFSEGSVSALHTVYRLDGAKAQDVQAYLIAAKAEDASIDIVSIDNISRALNLKKTLVFGKGGSAIGLCGGNIHNDEFVVFAANGTDLIRVDIEATADGAFSVLDASPLGLSGAIDCAVDPRDGALFALDKDGAVHYFDEDGAPQILRAADRLAIALGLMPRSVPILENEPEQADLVLSAPNGAITVFSRDGAPRGVFQMAASFDYSTPNEATALGAGYGNFGAVYRDGVIALAAPGPAFNEDAIDDPAMNADGFYIRLVPWNGVMSGLALPVEPPVTPRNPKPSEYTDGVIDIQTGFDPNQ